ncbi:MAG: alpha/beta hydrolase [Vicinamibacterales bacterium]|nr:alpha/beta hydrolase [Vicinamibacterales bacterium]
MPRLKTLLAGVVLVMLGYGEAGAQLMTTRDLLALPQPPADRRIAYGPEPSQFGDLRMPVGPGPHPVVVFIHGGCWMAEYDLLHTNSFTAALAAEGIAVWSLEYRRVGEAGGGWPGTMEDVARGADHLRVVARQYAVDLTRVAVAGHSAGGHLALWVGARGRVPAGSGLPTVNPLKVTGVVALAAISDLAAAVSQSVCDDAASQLMGGLPAAYPLRYQAASPAELLPLGVRQFLVHGARDTVVPLAMAEAHRTRAAAAGDRVTLTVIPDAGHVELVAPRSIAWTAVLAAIRAALIPG